jgi:myo-inositol-1-phosphate synthase
MIYAYAALKSGVPFANGAPNLTVDIPALMSSPNKNKLADLRQGFQDRPDVDEDDHRAGLEIAHAGPARLVLDQHPRQPRRRSARRSRIVQDKEESKLSVLEYILQPDVYPELYKDFSHVVRINYYPPRGDNKEGWDNIDIFGWLGYPMQIKIDFLCRDNSCRDCLAAPISLVLDLALFKSRPRPARRNEKHGMRGRSGSRSTSNLR